MSTMEDDPHIPLSASEAVLHAVITPWGEFTPAEMEEAKGTCRTYGIPAVYASGVAAILRRLQARKESMTDQTSPADYRGKGRRPPRTKPMRNDSRRVMFNGNFVRWGSLTSEQQEEYLQKQRGEN